MVAALLLLLAGAAPAAVYLEPLAPADDSQRAAQEVHSSLSRALRDGGLTLAGTREAAAVRIRVTHVEVVTTEEPDPRPKRAPVKVRAPGKIYYEDTEVEKGVTRTRWHEVRVRVTLACGGDAAVELQGPARETSAKDAGRALGRRIAARVRGGSGVCSDGGR